MIKINATTAKWVGKYRNRQTIPDCWIRMEFPTFYRVFDLRKIKTFTSIETILTSDTMMHRVSYDTRSANKDEDINRILLYEKINCNNYVVNFFLGKLKHGKQLNIILISTFIVASLWLTTKINIETYSSVSKNTKKIKFHWTRCCEFRIKKTAFRNCNKKNNKFLKLDQQMCLWNGFNKSIWTRKTKDNQFFVVVKKRVFYIFDLFY